MRATAPLVAASLAALLLTGCGLANVTSGTAATEPGVLESAAGPPPATVAPAASRSPSATAVPVPVLTGDAPVAPPSAPVEPPPAPAAPPPPPPGQTGSGGPDVPVAVAVESRVADVTTAELGAVVQGVLQDPRGWTRAGFRFSFAPEAPYRVVLAEPAEVDRLCRPYRTGGQWSCQVGPVVAINADRWRGATETWTASVDDYRVMVVNHEVGHLLGQHHPEEMCSSPGSPAALMAQQSKGLRGCAAGGWPLDWEVACAARHEEPLAPGYEASAEPTCGP